MDKNEERLMKRRAAGRKVLGTDRTPPRPPAQAYH